MIKHRYVLAHIEFSNLPPKLGIFAVHPQIDQVYQRVKSRVAYVVWCTEAEKILSEGVASHTEFENFLDKPEDRQNRGNYKLIHTGLYSAYYYNAMLMSNGKQRPGYDQFLLDLILANSGFIPESSNFRKELEKFGGQVLDYLRKCAPAIQAGITNKKYKIMIDWDDAYKPLNRRPCEAERLHCKYQHLPDPVRWIKLGYETGEVNEYTDYMNRFNFGIYKDQDACAILEILRKLG